jgi:hypothetical protein
LLDGLMNFSEPQSLFTGDVALLWQGGSSGGHAPAEAASYRSFLPLPAGLPGRLARPRRASLRGHDPACYLLQEEIDKERPEQVMAMEDDVLLPKQAA